MEVRKYRITGVVQGVGFRPFIHKITAKLNIKGWILNDSEGVLLEVESSSQNLDDFISEVKNSPPPLAKITNVVSLPCNTPVGTYHDFIIKKSVTAESVQTLISPDFNLCDDCIRELYDEKDKRYKYPFINCTNCGPRYTIIQDIPYDRHNTTMKKFVFCPTCKSEYLNIDDRRYHAQPNACPDCGPSLQLFDNQGNQIDPVDVLAFTSQNINDGHIIAVKSLGGFHLTCDAQNEAAIKKLRNRKKRDSKPFALMAKNISTIEKFAYVSRAEADLLQSIQRPIVLLRKREDIQLPDCIAPHNPNIGVMLPSAPIHYLLLSESGLDLLIMTSGNISSFPIIYKNENAIHRLKDVADYFLVNNRDIHTFVDDSIVRCSSVGQSDRDTMTMMIRRSRGYVPMPFEAPAEYKSILGVGAELKNTIALSHDHNLFVSQHLGDLKNRDTLDRQVECIEHLCKILTISPKIVACDMHPAYLSTVTAQSFSLPLVKVQHHHAHMASCMFENGINHEVIGVIMDGTGYGLDGTIWGGEFLLGDLREIKRVGHLRPFQLIGGDKAVEEPYRVALDLLIHSYDDINDKNIKEIFSDIDDFKIDVLCKMSRRSINSFKSSSVGRLFDAVSALLNICTVIEYEAQAAIELEALLNRNMDMADPFPFSIHDNGECCEIDYRPLIRAIITQRHKLSKEKLSRMFHSTVVSMVSEMCCKVRKDCSVNDVVLSGGVFLNEFLLVNTKKVLESQGFTVYCHSAIPCNDGGISVGQVAVANSRLT
ncbi:carbamoyltransferase HypF [Heliobacterium gestii]|uniref:Carbamoyltransferase n=1 Tax=Heliomicrobium gestii TaxID=2699 RepID=A0A845L5B5_HELGE|nr:carbamoyltransferase HypF [Heliomicrobium gestii]MBM7865556.1 hydrogenase maturation protein HypF [Heliomicrobium gestii]MZP41807.1 carbamoyltransferase HypF [Heliomicrobium gestii]